MNKSINTAVLFCLLVSTISCNHVYRKYDKDSFPSMIWRDGQEVTFDPTIEDVSKPYQIIMGVRHHYEVPVKKLGVRMTITSPSGKKRSDNFELQLMTPEGERSGDCAGDMCDLETIVLNTTEFEEQGQYKISLSHTETGSSIPGILEVGLIIDPVQ